MPCVETALGIISADAGDVRLRYDGSDRPCEFGRMLDAAGDVNREEALYSLQGSTVPLLCSTPVTRKQRLVLLNLGKMNLWPC